MFASIIRNLQAFVGILFVVHQGGDAEYALNGIVFGRSCASRATTAGARHLAKIMAVETWPWDLPMRAAISAWVKPES